MAMQPFNVVLINDTSVDNHHGCSRVMKALHRLINRIGGSVTAQSPTHADWRKLPAVLGAMEQAQLVVVNGEGTIHHNAPQADVLLDVAAYCRDHGIPSVLLNALWQANGIALLEKARDFSLIAVRDGRSFRQLADASIDSAVLPDLSMYLRASTSSERRGIGFAGSVDREVTVMLDDLRRSCRARYLPIQRSSGGLLGTYEFFRRYVGRADMRQPSFLARLLATRFRQWRTQSGSDLEFLQKLASVKLLVSGRFHAVTMAALVETPFLAAGTDSHKIAAFVEDAGLCSWRLMPGYSKDTVLEAQKAGWESAELDALRSYISDGRKRVDRFFGEIRVLV